MSIPATFSQSYVVAASPAAAAETVVASLGGVCTQLPGQTIKLHGWVNGVVGTDSTGWVLRIRKGDIAGAVVAGPSAASVDTTTFTSGAQADVFGSDPGETVAGATYVLTLECTAASASTTVGAVFLEARVD